MWRASHSRQLTVQSRGGGCGGIARGQHSDRTSQMSSQQTRFPMLPFIGGSNETAAPQNRVVIRAHKRVRLGVPADAVEGCQRSSRAAAPHGRRRSRRRDRGSRRKRAHAAPTFGGTRARFDCPDERAAKSDRARHAEATCQKTAAGRLAGGGSGGMAQTREVEVPPPECAFRGLGTRFSGGEKTILTLREATGTLH